MSFKIAFIFSMLQIMLLLTSCSDTSNSTGSGSSSGSGVSIDFVVSSNDVVISWNANKESAVNTTGGGYKVYYSSTPGFSITDFGVTEVDVAYSSGTTSPTSTALNLSSGNHYIRIMGYSALAGGTTGDLSSQTSVTVQ